MSFISDALGGNSYEIGDLILAPEAGVKFTRKGRDFSRCGSAIPAAAYPSASSNSRTMINGLPSSGFPASRYIISHATDGAGKWIFILDNGSAYMSINNGATVASISISITASSVVWNQSTGRFIAFGNSSNTVSSAHWDGVASGFTSGGTFTPAVTMTANSIRAACDGTTAVASWAPTTTTTIATVTTTDASALTSVAFGGNAGAGIPFLTVLPSLGASRWLTVYGTSQFVSTSANASSWGAATTSPQSVTGSIVGLASGNGISIFAGRTSYAISTNNTSWVNYAYPAPLTASQATFDAFAPGAASTLCANWLNFDGAHFITGTATYADFGNAAQGKFGFTADGVTWMTRQLTYPGASAALSQRQQASSNGYLLSYQTGVAGAASHISITFSANWKNAADYVGIARPIIPQTPANSSAVAYYVSIS